MAKSKYGQWEVQEIIGEGGAGQVFRVVNSETKEVGALKRLKNTNRRQRFREEVDALRKLNHPGIVKVLYANTESDPYFAVFEYEPGGNLGDIPPDELMAISVSDRLLLFEQLCDAVQAAHSCELVHRDIKPDNVLISRDRKTVRLCDFGLVYCEDGERQTQTMEQVGSRYYIPPELEEGRADEVSARSDVYSLGKVLYFLMAGRVFAREQHRADKHDLSKMFGNPHLESISRILDKSVHSEVGSRLKSVSEMKTMVADARQQIALQLPVAGVESTYRCVFCKIGIYKIVCHSMGSDSHNNGYNEGNVGTNQLVFLECQECGNCQRFKLKINGSKWFKEMNDAVTRRMQR